MRRVSAAGTRLAGRLPAVFELREQSLPALFSYEIPAHEAFVDLARSLLAASHGIRHVGCACDDVAAGIETGAAGLQRKSIHPDRTFFFEFQSGSAAEILIECLTHGEDHVVALEAQHFICWDGPAAAGLVQTK